MTVRQLHKSQRFMPCECTLATYFIHAIFVLTSLYNTYYHVIRLIKNGLVIKPSNASWGNGNSICTYGHMLIVGSGLFKDTI